MFDKIANFDVAKLTLAGWLLFLATAAMFLAACFLLAFHGKEVADAALKNRLSQRVLGISMMAVAVLFFVAARKLMEWLGVTIYRDDG